MSTLFTVFKDGWRRSSGFFSRSITTLGVKKMIIGINKMDTHKYSESRFKEITAEVEKFIKKVGYNPKEVAMVPISGFHGDNMIEPSTNMSWYKGWNTEVKKVKHTGNTLIEAIDAVPPPKFFIPT